MHYSGTELKLYTDTETMKHNAQLSTVICVVIVSNIYLVFHLEDKERFKKPHPKTRRIILG